MLTPEERAAFESDPETFRALHVLKLKTSLNISSKYELLQEHTSINESFLKKNMSSEQLEA